MYQEAETCVLAGPAPGEPSWGSQVGGGVGVGGLGHIWVPFQALGPGMGWWAKGLMWDCLGTDGCVSACTQTLTSRHSPVLLSGMLAPITLALTPRCQFLLSGVKMFQQELPQGIPVLGLHVEQDGNVLRTWDKWCGP